MDNSAQVPSAPGMPGQPDPNAPAMPPSSPPQPSMPPPAPVPPAPPAPPQPTAPTPPAPEPAMPSNQSFTTTPTGFAVATIPAPVSQGAPIPPPPSSSHHIKRILIVVIFLAVVGSAGYYVYSLNFASTPQQPAAAPTAAPLSPTPTPNPTANWTMFEDPKLQFSVKHPLAWFSYPATTLAGESAVYSYDMTQKPGKEIPNTEFKFAVTRVTAEQPVAPENIVSETDVVVAGIPAKKQIVKGLGTNIFVSVKKDRYTYQIAGYPSDSSYKDTFDQILSTFTLTDQVTATPAANSGAQGAAAPLGGAPTATGAGIASPAAR